MSFFSNRKQQSEDTVDKEPAPSNPKPSIGFETVIGSTCRVEGSLTSEGNIRIDGTFVGNLDISGNILVGEKALVEADIDARAVSIAGSVTGNVKGVKVQLLRTARIYGDIQAQSLTIEDGAYIEGRIAMPKPEDKLIETEGPISEVEAEEILSEELEDSEAVIVETDETDESYEADDSESA